MSRSTAKELFDKLTPEDRDFFGFWATSIIANPLARWISEDQHARTLELFNRIDVNRSGYLDEGDFTLGQLSDARKQKKLELWQGFKKIADFDGDGKISKDEFYGALLFMAANVSNDPTRSDMKVAHDVNSQSTLFNQMKKLAETMQVNYGVILSIINNALFEN